MCGKSYLNNRCSVSGQCVCSFEASKVKKRGAGGDGNGDGDEEREVQETGTKVERDRETKADFTPVPAGSICSRAET